MRTVGLAIICLFPDIFLYQCWHKTNYEMKTSAIEPLVRPGNGGMAIWVSLAFYHEPLSSPGATSAEES